MWIMFDVVFVAICCLGGEDRQDVEILDRQERRLRKSHDV